MPYATSRKHDVNFGDRSVIRGGAVVPLAEISLAQSQALTVSAAATRIVPAGATASIERNTHFASAAANDAETAGTRPLSYAAGPSGRDGTDQYLNGRGLY